MTARLFAGWDFARLGTHRMTVTESTGSLAYEIVFKTTGVGWEPDGGGTFTVTDASTTYCHVDLSSVMGSGLYEQFTTALDGALTNASAADGNALSFTVTFAPSTGKLTITPSAGTIAINFSSHSNEGTRMRQLLGFSGNVAAAAALTSDVRAYYSLESTHGAISRPSEDYRQSRSRGAVAMDGSHFALDLPGVPTRHDFSISHEPEAATFSRHAGSSAPWTFEHFIDHVGAVEPFVVITDDESTVHTLTPEGANFDDARERMLTDPHRSLYWRWNLRTYVEGRL